MLNQPRERVDSDEIELRDSEDGCDETDDCEFSSLEGKVMPNEHYLPRTQTITSSVEQLNRLKHQNRLDANN